MSNVGYDNEASLSSDCPPCPGQPVVERVLTRTAHIGEGLVIRRALPSRQRRMVGAWCFLDHAGPIDSSAGQGLRVGPHPHIGIQTFTWMIEGEVVHRDSLGYEQVIRPGQVNLMTTGRGIAHAEDSIAHEGGRLHAAQLWIALPDAERHRAPEFQNYADLPTVEDGGFRVTVLAGTAFGRRSPATVYSALVGLDLTANDAAALSVPVDRSFEYAALTLRGKAQVEAEELPPDVLLYLGSGRPHLSVSCAAASRLLLLGGLPFDEQILMWWNFVARTPAEIGAAVRDWNAGERFGEVVGSPSPRIAAPDVTEMRIKRAHP